MRKAILACFCACALGTAAEVPYAGAWKINYAKSNFGDTTVTYEQLAGGAMKATMDGQSYTFQTDGKDTMTPWGMTVAWKAVDARTWQTTEKVKGQVTATGTLKLSADGQQLSFEATRRKTDGGSSQESVAYQRVSGGPGLAGLWKTKNLKSSSPEMLLLTPKGADGLTVGFGNAGAACDARFDGKDYPATGDIFPAGWTCQVARQGERGFGLTWKKDGKAMYQSTMQVSADGKALTETGSAVGVSEKVVAVYDRQ